MSDGLTRSTGERAVAEWKLRTQLDVLEARIAAIETRQLDLEAQRDRAREECGHEKAMRRSQRDELDRYLDYYRKVKRVEAVLQTAREVSPSPSMSVYVQDIRNALDGIAAEGPRKLGQNEAAP